MTEDVREEHPDNQRSETECTENNNAHAKTAPELTVKYLIASVYFSQKNGI